MKTRGQGGLGRSTLEAGRSDGCCRGRLNLVQMDRSARVFGGRADAAPSIRSPGRPVPRVAAFPVASAPAFHVAVVLLDFTLGGAASKTKRNKNCGGTHRSDSLKIIDPHRLNLYPQSVFVINGGFRRSCLRMRQVIKRSATSCAMPCLTLDAQSATRLGRSLALPGRRQVVFVGCVQSSGRTTMHSRRRDRARNMRFMHRSCMNCAGLVHGRCINPVRFRSLFDILRHAPSRS